jgi:glycosyltransferase involved in cell wall biosynthesis
VGIVYDLHLMRKGHGPFCEAAAMVDDAEWVLAGAWKDDTGRELQANAAENLQLTGYLSDEELDDLFRRAGVYVQASLHEGFGMSLAEAMLAGAVPVVTTAGALPEVVGDTGVVIDEATAESVAAGVTKALALGPEARVAASERVRTQFPYEKRRDGILRELDHVLAGERS